MKINRNLILSSICLFILAVSISAQKTWEKPMEKWSKDDALKVLSSSPWSQTYQSTSGSSFAAAQQVNREQSQTANSGGSNPRSVARNFGPPPVVVRLHSAMPIRQAIVRLQQISANYDKLDEKKKAEFDAGTKVFLGCAICQNYYVVTLTQFTDSSGQFVEEGIFQTMTLKDFQGNIWLENEKGEKRELVQFTPPKGRGDSAVFFFARKDNKGDIFLTPEIKDFKLVFKNEFLETGNRYAGLVPRKFEFKVSKMMVADSLLF